MERYFIDDNSGKYTEIDETAFLRIQQENDQLFDHCMKSGDMSGLEKIVFLFITDDELNYTYKGM